MVTKTFNTYVKAYLYTSHVKDGIRKNGFYPADVTHTKGWTKASDITIRHNGSKFNVVFSDPVNIDTN